MTAVSIRDLRTKFPKIRRLLDRDDAVIVTDRGEPRYVLRPYTAPTKRRHPPLDLYKRLVTRMPKKLSEAQSRALDEHNRGDR